VVLVPFARQGKLIGTVWVAAHTPEKVFDDGDIALVKRLTTFTSAVLDSRMRKNA
jgi:GAF domain-containing protein